MGTIAEQADGKRIGFFGFLFFFHLYFEISFLKGARGHGKTFSGQAADKGHGM